MEIITSVKIATWFGYVIYKLMNKLFSCYSLFCALIQLLERNVKVKNAVQPFRTVKGWGKSRYTLILLGCITY